MVERDLHSFLVEQEVPIVGHRGRVVVLLFRRETHKGQNRK